MGLAQKPICSTIGARRSWFSATSRRSTSSFLPIRAMHILAPLWQSFSLAFHSSKTAMACGLYAITTTKKSLLQTFGPNAFDLYRVNPWSINHMSTWHVSVPLLLLQPPSTGSLPWQADEDVMHNNAHSAMLRTAGRKQPTAAWRVGDGRIENKGLDFPYPIKTPKYQ